MFSWAEWAAALSAEVKQPDAAADGSDYYDCWLRALEKLLAAKGIAAPRDVDRLAEAWQRAAHATPHGKPILLENDPEHRRRVGDRLTRLFQEGEQDRGDQHRREDEIGDARHQRDRREFA